VGVACAAFYYLKMRGPTMSVLPNEIVKIEFEDSVLGNVAPPITDRKIIEKWSQNLNESKFTKNADYHLSVILGRVCFEGADGVPKVVVCANLEQNLLAIDPKMDSSYVYTADRPQLFDDIVDYIKTENGAYYNHQMDLLKRLQTK